jgi:hypothetical protein
MVVAFAVALEIVATWGTEASNTVDVTVAGAVKGVVYVI